VGINPTIECESDYTMVGCNCGVDAAGPTACSGVKMTLIDEYIDVNSFT